MTTSSPTTAIAKRILVVEDEYFVAVDLTEGLEESGFQVVGPAADLPTATKLAANEPVLHAALLDVNLRGEFVWPVVEILEKRAVPMILTTGYNASESPSLHAHLPRQQKPVTIQALVQQLQELIGTTTEGS